MAYKGINFARQHLVPVDDGNLYRAIFQDGSLHGCQVSTSGAVLTMTAGYIMCAGRQIEITADESFTLNEQTSGYARILLQIDLTQTATESTFQQVSTLIQYAASEEGFATLIQQDINNGGSLYQMQLALVSLAAGGISAIVEDLPVAELRGGGAGATLEVTGVVTSPASTVTITNSALGKTYTKTLDFAGKATFKGLASGTWNITMTDGTQTSTGSIVIDNEYEKVVSYWNGELYLNGNEYVDITGGWIGSRQVSGTAIVKNATTISVYAASGNSGQANTSNKIDLTDYNYIEANITKFADYLFNFFIITNSRTVSDVNFVKSAQFTTTGTVRIDVSDLSGEYYVGFSVYGGGVENHMDFSSVIMFK